MFDESECPNYRVRLFLTVDLVGSTAFKAHRDTNTADLYPLWVDVFKKFYQQFPSSLDAAYRETKSCRADNLDASSGPKLWKIIGDEILFCCTVQSLQHLSCCVSAFLATLQEYGQLLEDETGQLDVKGAGWTAAFPSENISIALDDGNITATLADKAYVTEEFEAGADRFPHRHDFLGPSIDAGFRVAKNASTDRFSASVELAYLLADAWENRMFGGRFSYHGREELKGVNRGRAYPIVSVETERNAKRREVNTRERALTQEPEVTALALRDFLRSYMERDTLEIPVLPMDPTAGLPPPPPSYDRFKSGWEVTARGAAEQDESISVSESEGDNSGDAPLSQAVTDFADLFRQESQRAIMRNAMVRAVKALAEAQATGVTPPEVKAKKPDEE